MRKKYPSNYFVGSESRPRPIYALIDPRDNTVRYVGIRKDSQVRLRQHLYKYSDGKRLLAWLEEQDRLGLSPDLQILVEYVECAVDVEKRLAEHLRDKNNTPKCRWLAELKRNGLLPELEILEVVDGFYGAFSREGYWNKRDDSGRGATD